MEFIQSQEIIYDNDTIYLPHWISKHTLFIEMEIPILKITTMS
jgi:hypothetical protein